MYNKRKTIKQKMAHSMSMLKTHLKSHTGKTEVGSSINDVFVSFSFPLMGDMQVTGGLNTVIYFTFSQKNFDYIFFRAVAKSYSQFVMCET